MFERREGRELAVLDFDCECRPLAWYGGDFVTKQITAIAWSWYGSDEVHARSIGAGGPADVLAEEAHILETFRAAYDKADVVTGHYIVGFDLPLVSGSLVRLHRPPLAAKMVQDTKGHMVKAQGISKSQENLGAMYGLKAPKEAMNTTTWGNANMLLQDGRVEVHRRVVGDVRQHKQLRLAMLEAGHLGAPRMWYPSEK